MSEDAKATVGSGSESAKWHGCTHSEQQVILFVGSELTPLPVGPAFFDPLRAFSRVNFGHLLLRVPSRNPNVTHIFADQILSSFWNKETQTGGGLVSEKQPYPFPLFKNQTEKKNRPSLSLISQHSKASEPTKQPKPLPSLSEPFVSHDEHWMCTITTTPPSKTSNYSETEALSAAPCWHITGNLIAHYYFHLLKKVNMQHIGFNQRRCMKVCLLSELPVPRPL